MPRCWSEPTTKDAYRISWFSMLLTLSAAFAGFSLWKAKDSSLALMFGLENFVDWFSDAIVLWRFFAPGGDEVVDQATEKKLKSREQRASVGISVVLLFLGIFVIIASTGDYERGKEEDSQQNSIVMISLISAPSFALLGWTKIHYAKHLDSESLYKDGVCTLVGCILAIAMFIDAIIVEEDSALWWLDPVVAMIGGAFSLLYGLISICLARFKYKMPIFSPYWWFSSKIDIEVPAHRSNGDHNKTQRKDLRGEVI